MTMSGKLRPLAALATVALIGAGCGSNAAPETASSGGSKAMRFAGCMRANGVKEFPDPNASGELTIDAVVNGSSIDTDGPAWKHAVAACRDLQPAGFTGTKVSSEQQETRLKFAQCMRDNGIDDFPDPIKDGPLIDTSRMPGAPAAHSIPGFDAAVHKCGEVYSGQLGVR